MMSKKLNSKPGQPKYERLANELVREAWHVAPCATCGYPALRGRLCSNVKCNCSCGSASQCDCSCGSTSQCDCECECECEVCDGST